MNSSDHPRAQLSAYLDGALGEPERVAVEGHLGSCTDCRARLGELRATASLIRSLPDPVPSRRLVPRVAAPPAWLAPLRTLTTLASGVSVFLFLATALLANVGGVASSAGTAAAPAERARPSGGDESGGPLRRRRGETGHDRNSIGCCLCGCLTGTGGRRAFRHNANARPRRSRVGPLQPLAVARARHRDCDHRARSATEASHGLSSMASSSAAHRIHFRSSLGASGRR